MKTPLRTANGKSVGILEGKTLHKRAIASKHLFRSIGKEGSWGIDYSILYTLPQDGNVLIDEVEGRVRYVAEVKDWKEKGIIKHFKQGSKDHYTQVFLPIENFVITKL